MEVRAGFDPAHREAVARLFWAAFRGKLGRILWPERKALAFIAAIVQPRFALSAVEDGRLLGVAGFKLPEGGFMAGNLADMARHYGWLGAAWRGPLLDLFERDLVAGQLLMDGIFVAEGARGRGVGTALIGAIMAEAAARGCGEVRLDVVEGNERARRLYERCGFVARGEVRAGLLAPVLGFRRAVTMVAAVE
ncbi:GNAT family N-acetyltransferase [Vannielia litorea]|uniref:Acetyltransferase (GNAT) family protein n=1 Tax=Vannielia litorea TaxID=1217970 RepID=A0A1N6HQ45_9RHOB|nr:GNAT family N-acetyltransferase [Vannielia litorea]SIO21785.1 Acetyltransferase (GNAT) family protein [Vannielia litorea]